MYLDTSVLLKLFVREPESEFYGSLTDGRVISTSVLAYTEAWSALLFMERAGRINAQQRQRAWAGLERNFQEDTIELLPMGPALFRRANRVLEACHPVVPLRSLDALHLASADQAQDWPLATGDRRMRDAAQHLKFPLAPLPA